jgi:hypothetical protein
VLRTVVAATYHQVWWPHTDTVVYPDSRLPTFDSATGSYTDPDTGAPLPTWEQALDGIDGDPDAQPAHVVRFGPQLDIQGVLAGSPDADRRVGYLTKYLTKTVDQCHTPDTDAQAEHVDRLWQALRYEPCSPTCANWLRYGVQPRHPRAGLVPGRCRGKAHRRETLGFGGRRVLVSRKWSGKTLTDHRRDRRDWVARMLGQPVTGTGDGGEKRHVWLPVARDDPDLTSSGTRLLAAIAQRLTWKAALDEARHRATGPPGPDVSATHAATAA